MSEYAIEMMHTTKLFPGVVANDDIVLQVRRGEIHALLGENGAGKSTLVSILFGLYQPDKGELFLDGKPVKIQNPHTANDLGIGMVHQHFMLVKNFTVLENIILGAETVRGGRLRMDEARAKVLSLSERYNMKVDLDANVSDISVGMQQRVEILKMLYRENNILIFDEPTAVLTPQEIDELMGIMRGLKAEGKSILFITHKLSEIMAVADRCSVLRKGKYIGTVDIKDTTKEELSRMMVGRNVNFAVEKAPAQPGEVVLDVQHLTMASKLHKNNAVKDVSFQVRAGEIVCIAGIDGNGQTELVYGITGLEGMKQINMKILSYGKLKGTAVYIRRIVQCDGLFNCGKHPLNHYVSGHTVDQGVEFHLTVCQLIDHALIALIHFQLIHDLIHLSENCLHLTKLSFRRPLCGQIADLRLDYASRFTEIRNQLFLRYKLKPIGIIRKPRYGGNISSLPPLDIEDVFGYQYLYCFPYRSPAHIQIIHQFILVGKLGSQCKFTCHNLSFYLIRDIL